MEKVKLVRLVSSFLFKSFILIGVELCVPAFFLFKLLVVVFSCAVMWRDMLTAFLHCVFGKKNVLNATS